LFQCQLKGGNLADLSTEKAKRKKEWMQRTDAAFFSKIFNCSAEWGERTCRSFWKFSHSSRL